VAALIRRSVRTTTGMRTAWPTSFTTSSPKPLPTLTSMLGTGIISGGLPFHSSGYSSLVADLVGVGGWVGGGGWGLGGSVPIWRWMGAAGYQV
jgi:hypothetical protein